MSLKLCASCARHVRTTDTTCPFCNSVQSTAVPQPISRATRAAMVFGGATLVVAGVACGGNTDDGTKDASTSPTSTTTSTSTSTAAPAYGAPPQDAATDTGPVAMYGAPPPQDGGAVPPYGAPPPLDGGTD